MGRMCLWRIVRWQMKLELALIYVRYIGRRACTTIIKVELSFTTIIRQTQLN